MKLTNIGTCNTIDEFVNYKIGLFEGKDKDFCNLFENMFTEDGNVMVERTNGHRIIKTTYGQCKTEIYKMASVLSDTLKGTDVGSMIGIYMKNSLEWIEVFWGLLMCGPLLIWTGGSTPLLCLEGVPDLPVAPQDEAGLTKTFQTWPRGWFHIP